MDPNEADFMKFMANVENPPYDFEEATFILENIGVDFCCMYAKEREIYLKYIADHHEDKNIIWKPFIDDLREICDICETTILNYHWTCQQCGMSVCLNCYDDRWNNKKKII